MSEHEFTPPYPFEHEDSAEDLIEYHQAIEQDGVPALFRRWADEDEKAQEAADQAEKQQQRDAQLTYINSSLRKQETRHKMVNKKFLSVKEVSELLDKSEKTVRRWTERESFPLPVIKKPNKSQNTWSFDRDEVLKWFELYQQK